mmetsp:Transcript_13930/g.58143  ORF Transcript_13930/g.58143 Transcript_13930/m.58143 type:complete len:302 (+) Transcript_13930:77-982(+)
MPRKLIAIAAIGRCDLGSATRAWRHHDGARAHCGSCARGVVWHTDVPLRPCKSRLSVLSMSFMLSSPRGRHSTSRCCVHARRLKSPVSVRVGDGQGLLPSLVVRFGGRCRPRRALVAEAEGILDGIDDAADAQLRLHELSLGAERGDVEFRLLVLLVVVLLLRLSTVRVVEGGLRLRFLRLRFLWLGAHGRVSKIHQRRVGILLVRPEALPALGDLVAAIHAARRFEDDINLVQRATRAQRCEPLAMRSQADHVRAPPLVARAVRERAGAFALVGQLVLVVGRLQEAQGDAVGQFGEALAL